MALREIAQNLHVAPANDSIELEDEEPVFGAEHHSSEEPSESLGYTFSQLASMNGGMSAAI